MQPTLDLTVIIPNYNTKDFLKQCLTSIYTNTTDLSFEVICLDENSRDGSADMVSRDFPQAVLIRNETPRYYVGNNNLGMTMSQARYACLLNSDTLIIGNAFRNL